jgi:hypothetical protein
MGDIDKKRDFVMGLGKSPGWRKKVKAMPDSQVIAIYLREHNKPKKQDPKPNKESGGDDIPF